MRSRIFEYAILISFLLIFMSSVSANDPVATNLGESADQADGATNYVLGRPVESTYQFDIEAYEPIDTVFAIDESGSMSEDLGDAQDAAKDYIDNTRTAEGDENAVISFDTGSDLKQSLTSSKYDAKEAVDEISDGGGTDIVPAIEDANDELNSGGNDIEVMLVLGDGDSDTDTEDTADDARDDGIEVHGIMYGSGADAGEFERLSGASQCTKNSDENNDGDNCWYAETGTIDSVYNSILQDVSTETDATLRMRLNDDAYSDDISKFESGTEYDKEYNDIDDGSYNHNLEWRPTVPGNQELVTGDSEIFLDYEGGSNTFSFSGSDSYNVEEVDFDAVSFDAHRENLGDVEVEVEVENIGTVGSRPREVSIVDDGGNRVSESLPTLSVGESQNIDFTVDASNSVLDDVENLNIIADYQGYWNSVSNSEVGVSEARGDTLEADESNNELDLGYPPQITNIGFNDWTDHHGFEVVADVDMLTSSGDFGECSMSFEDQDGNRYPSTGKIEGELSAESSTRAECRYDSVNNSISGFEVYDDIDVNVSVEDEKGTSNWDTGSNEIPNQAPDIDRLISPQDGSIVTGEEADLEVEVSDSEGDEFNLTFFNARENTDIATVEDAHLNSNHEYIWEVGLGDFEWGVRLEDPYDTYEETWSFRRVISDSFRLSKNIEYKYSSLIVTESGQSNLMLEVANTHPEPKNITTDVSTVQGNVNASFASYSGGVYQLESGENKRFQIEVEADEGAGAAKDALRFNSTDQQIGAETVEEFPVYVRSSEQESRGVPGLTATMIYIIGLVSVLLFGLSV
ncbi:MAG: vWA domain-containing protein [Candidatus Nanohaloarchaea archaeon]